MERAGVREDRDVDVRGALSRQRHTQLADEVIDHLPARRGAQVEPVHRAVLGVPEVVVDVDHKATLKAGHTGAGEVATLHDDHGIAGIVD
jgi:molecular chaperone DnaK (HSP70)